ncbi:dual specificity protein phosphatase family protein [Roseinatronobacter alkalisoli]|uniref:Dual specificity protein phosphatase n=1 Tax=Roseinatronobacter alkalisoli TaxID=3028235 RepID=A0ABT5T4Q2_9RHOB|nr:dual specificity protein phosphatase [Roseinatronobacter sp. HJB301]MDD7969966.1 dual specificity protein phosphatase [Roseinatronobacter sp. HJB301]
MAQVAPHYDRPDISMIATDVGEDKVSLFIGGSDGARNLGLLRENGITTVINCAVNLDFNYVTSPVLAAEGDKVATGHGAIRAYKIGLIDGEGNPSRMMLAGYYILDGALKQTMPDRASYPNRERGNILVHCRGGRSRSVALVALFLVKNQQHLFPSFEDALAHVREKRELRRDEWFETPKPMLIEAAKRASDAIDLLEGR